MAERLRVEDQTLVSVSNRLLSAGMIVERAKTTLVTGVDRLDGCWGESDEVAQQFVKEYVPGRDAVLAGITQVSTLLRTLGERVARTSTSFIALEQDNTAGAEALLTGRSAALAEPVVPMTRLRLATAHVQPSTG
jgi:hypothetical protein